MAIGSSTGRGYGSGGTFLDISKLVYGSLAVPCGFDAVARTLAVPLDFVDQEKPEPIL
jgi:hypothetical protein